MKPSDDLAFFSLLMEMEAAKAEQVAFERVLFVSGRSGMMRVAKRYHVLLSQIRSVLDTMDFVRVPDYVKEEAEKYDPLDEKGPKRSSAEATVMVRMKMIEGALEYASLQTGVSAKLLAAMSWVESKMIPYAVNVDGKAYYFTSRQRAERMLRRLKTNDVDIGLFQINYRLWGKPLGLQKEDLLDAWMCSMIGAMILKYNLQRHEDPWEAVGRYHSRNTERMRAYRDRVSRGLEIIRTLSTHSPYGERTAADGSLRQSHSDLVPHSFAQALSQ